MVPYHPILLVDESALKQLVEITSESVHKSPLSMCWRCYSVLLAGVADGAAANGEQRTGRSRRSTRKVTDFALLHEGNTQELTAKVPLPIPGTTCLLMCICSSVGVPQRYRVIEVGEM